MFEHFAYLQDREKIWKPLAHWASGLQIISSIHLPLIKINYLLTWEPVRRSEDKHRQSFFLC